jgi:uncharacterized protein (TIGR03084 family)
MVGVIEDLSGQHAQLRTLVEGCSDTDWRRETPCEGWDVGDVLLHLVLSDELAIASARGDLDSFTEGFLGPRDEARITVDAAAAAHVDSERAIGGAAIASRWNESSHRLLAELRTGDPHRAVTWVSGQFSLLTLATTRLAESWIHTGDIASALGLEVVPTDRIRHIVRLAWRILPYAFKEAHMSLTGPVALSLVGPKRGSVGVRPRWSTSDDHKRECCRVLRSRRTAGCSGKYRSDRDRSGCRNCAPPRSDLRFVGFPTVQIVHCSESDPTATDLPKGYAPSRRTKPAHGSSLISEMLDPSRPWVDSPMASPSQPFGDWRQNNGCTKQPADELYLHDLHPGHPRAGVAGPHGPRLHEALLRHQRAGEKTFRSDWKTGSAYDMAHEEVGLVVSDPNQVILESDPSRRLSYTWHTITPEWVSAVGMDEATAAAWRAEPRSKVAFDIEDVGHGTAQLTVVHDGFEPGSSVLLGISEGWPAVLSSLKTLLETGSTLRTW